MKWGPAGSKRDEERTHLANLGVAAPGERLSFPKRLFCIRRSVGQSERTDQRHYASARRGEVHLPVAGTTVAAKDQPVAAD
jgi:hypothetical protein